MNFTQNQQNAIDTRDCSLIISAGAGSGKTAVLTERILERICDENDDCNINDFLIVTFTKAAAKELSDRIRKKLSLRAREMPHNKKIIKNIALMPLAKIMTINAFCYEIVRENFQKIGLPSSVRIADESEIAVIRQKLMNRIVDEYFENDGDDEVFLAAYEIFSSSKNDEGFIETLLTLDLKLSNVADREGFCKNVLKAYRQVSDKEEFFDTEIGSKTKNYIQNTAEKTMEVLQKLMNACAPYGVLMDKYYPVLEHEFEFARSVYHACEKGYGNVRDVVNSHTVATFKGRNIPSSFENPALKEAVSEGKKASADKFFEDMQALLLCSPLLLKTAADDVERIVAKLLEIVARFEERLLERKKELSIMEFSDAERFTLSLLVKSFSPFEVTDFAKNLSESYKEIYIDEYQDVNPLQDMIFKAISKQKPDGEYNRFMVGDIKQSIYRFRGARSEIFSSYRDTFVDLESEGNAKRIFMSDNFRCSESVIGLTNLLFERLMGKMYTEGDRLNFARPEEKKIDGKVDMCVFEYNKNFADGVSAPELEAALICDKIKKIVNNPEYTDSDGRMYSFSDIGILAKNKAELRVFESILNSCGIPSHCNFGESFFGKKEVLLCINILNSIDNPERDIYLAGFMRSFAGGFSDDELAIIKNKYRKLSLYRAVITFSEDMKESYPELSERCGAFVEKLREYRAYSRGKSADKLLWKLFTDMDLLNFCCSDSFTNDKKGTRKNLLKLYQMAREYSKTSFRGAGAFIEYFNGSKENSDVKAEREIFGDSVTLMTIHGSKGLEFPVCFVSGLSKKFEKRDERAKLCFSENEGIALKLSDTAGINSIESETGLVTVETPFRYFISKQMGVERFEEDVRILYVAMTRARDMLIVTSAFSKKVENAMTDVTGCGFSKEYGKCNNFVMLMLSALAGESVIAPYYAAAGKSYEPTCFEAEKYLECSYLSGEEIKELYDSIVSQDADEQVQDKNCAVDEELLGELSKLGAFKYVHSDLPSKITVSHLKKGLIDEEPDVKDGVAKGNEVKEPEPPLFVTGERQADGAEKGTAMHMFMQFADYKNCENDCEKEADRLLSMGFIDKTQRGLLDTARLREFFSSEFYLSFKNSKKLYREQRFNLDLESFETELSGDVLVQGVIDLFYENDDGTYTVVDFKTDRVFGDGAEQLLIDRHKEQLMYYKRAVEEMTGQRVRDVLIYSFSLMKEISVK